MKFTAQEEYGLRCILCLVRGYSAQDADSAFMTVGTIAEAEGLSTQYAGKLFRILAKAELVESVRGCKGGYKLTRPPERISVGEVLTTLGGKFYEPKICERYVGDRKFCVHTNGCSIRSLWGGLQVILDAVLSSTNLLDLVGSEKPMTEWVQDNMAAVAEVLQKMRAGLEPAAAGQEIAVERGFTGTEIPVLQTYRRNE